MAAPVSDFRETMKLTYEVCSYVTCRRLRSIEKLLNHIYDYAETGRKEEIESYRHATAQRGFLTPLVCENTAG